MSLYLLSPADGHKTIRDSNKKYFIDTTEIHVARPNMEMISPMKDGMIEDWDTYEKLIDFAYKRVIRSDSEQHPVLMSEAPVSS